MSVPVVQAALHQETCLQVSSVQVVLVVHLLAVAPVVQVVPLQVECLQVVCHLVLDLVAHHLRTKVAKTPGKSNY